MRKANTQKLAFSGVIAALCTVLLFLSGVIPVATIALPALAGCLLIAVVVEAGTRWAFGVYATCSVLSLLLVADKEAALFYILFFGYYPVLYAFLGRIRNKAAKMAAKLVIFNAAMLLETFLSIRVLGIPWENVPFLGPYTAVVLLVLFNLVFLLYDWAMDDLILRYVRAVHPRVRKMFRPGR